MTPTEKSIRLLKARGYPVVERVEHWNSFAKCRQDLFGFADLLAVISLVQSRLGDIPGQMVLVQTTTSANFSARRKKILASKKAKIWLQAGGQIEIHGWKKGTAKDPRIEYITLEMFS